MSDTDRDSDDRIEWNPGPPFLWRWQGTDEMAGEEYDLLLTPGPDESRDWWENSGHNVTAITWDEQL